MAVGTELVILLSVLASALAAVMSAIMKAESENRSALETSYMVIMYAVLFLTPYVAYKFFVEGFDFTAPTLAAGFLAGVFGTGKVWAGVRAFQEIDFSIAEPMKKIAPLFVVVLELMFLGLDLSYLLVSGIILTVLGSYVLVIDPKSFLSPIKNLGHKGVKLAVLSAFFSALGALSIRYASGSIPSYGVTYLWYSANLAGLLFVLKKRERLPSKNVYLNRNFVIAGLLSSVSGPLSVFLYAVTSSVSLVTAVFQSSVLFSVLIGGEIFKEKRTGIRIIGGIIIVAGIFILSRV